MVYPRVGGNDGTRTQSREGLALRGQRQVSIKFALPLGKQLLPPMDLRFVLEVFDIWSFGSNTHFTTRFALLPKPLVGLAALHFFYINIPLDLLLPGVEGFFPGSLRHVGIMIWCPWHPCEDFAIRPLALRNEFAPALVRLCLLELLNGKLVLF